MAKTSSTVKTKNSENGEGQTKAHLQFSKDGRRVQLFAPDTPPSPIAHSKKMALAVLMVAVLNQWISKVEYLAFAEQVLDAPHLQSGYEDTDRFLNDPGVEVHVVGAPKDGIPDAFIKGILRGIVASAGSGRADENESTGASVTEPQFQMCECGAPVPHARFVLPKGNVSEALYSKKDAHAYLKACRASKKITAADGKRLRDQIEQSSLFKNDDEIEAARIKELLSDPKFKTKIAQA